MKTKLSNYLNKLVYIEWIDAYQDSDGGWKTILDIENWLDKWGDFTIKECGWIVKVNNKYIVLASQIHPEPDENAEIQYSMVQKIPITWIKKITEVKLNNLHREKVH